MKFATHAAAQLSTCAHVAFEGGRRSDAGSGRSARWSAVSGPARSGVRTTSNRRPPRHSWDQLHPRRSLWQLTTRPPRIRSGSQLPVEAGVSVFVRAGRTEAEAQNPQLVES